MKLCKKCNTLKEMGEFYEKSNSCKFCVSKQQRKWREANPTYRQEWEIKNKDTRRRKSREWHEANPEYGRTYYQQNKEKILAQAAQYRKENPEKYQEYRKKSLLLQRKHHLKTAYGITSEQFDLLFSNQKGICLICQQPSKRLLHVDHDHATGKVRGLLCGNCNSGLASFKEDKMLFNKAIDYLRLHS